MKIKFTLIIALFIGVAFIYTACKKSSNSSSGQKFTAKQVSSQVALNVTQTLVNGYGGFNLGMGLNAPETLNAIPKNRLKINDTDDPFCGEHADTTINTTTTENNVTASVKGSIGFDFNCTNNVLTGFHVASNIVVAESSANYTIAAKVDESLTLATANADNSKFSLNGTLNTDATYNYKTGSKQSGSQTFDYNYKNVIVDEDGIESGSASFTTKGTGTTGEWNFEGTITFLGNQQAKITINGTAYTVNLTTGVVS